MNKAIWVENYRVTRYMEVTGEIEEGFIPVESFIDFNKYGYADGAYRKIVEEYVEPLKYSWIEENPLIYEDGVLKQTYTIYNYPIEDIKEELKEEIKRHRKSVELGGISFMGETVQTGTESQSKILGMIAGMEKFPEVSSIDFKCVDGWLKLDAQEVGMMAHAVFTHIQTCFTKEGALVSMIKEFTTLDEFRNFDIETEWNNL